MKKYVILTTLLSFALAGTAFAEKGEFKERIRAHREQQKAENATFRESIGQERLEKFHSNDKLSEAQKSQILSFREEQRKEVEAFRAQQNSEREAFRKTMKERRKAFRESMKADG